MLTADLKSPAGHMKKDMIGFNFYCSTDDPECEKKIFKEIDMKYYATAEYRNLINRS